MTPSGPGIRLDSGVYAGWTVPIDYDPLLAKLIGYGEDRQQAISRLTRALPEYFVAGIKTNLGLFRRILADEDFRPARSTRDIWTACWRPKAGTEDVSAQKRSPQSLPPYSALLDSAASTGRLETRPGRIAWNERARPEADSTKQDGGRASRPMRGLVASSGRVLSTES